MPDAGTFARTFARIEQGLVTAEDVEAAFAAILAGAWTPIQIGAFATALRLRASDRADLLGAAARALRTEMLAVDHGLPEVLDTCGTGGDGAHTLNVSTAAAVVAAAAGARVAKHGNRSVSSRCGSADVVEALGVPLDVPPAAQAGVLHTAGIAFLMAPAHHPALKSAAQARRELGFRTIFNALGPLVNPARATHQLVGVYDDALRPVMARALGELGVRRAWVVRSVDGLDEISPADVTKVTVLDGGELEERVLAPEDFGVARGSLDALRGGDARDNAAWLADVLTGAPHDAVDAVVINAAAALVVARGGDLKEHAATCRALLASGAAAATLARWRDAARAATRQATPSGADGSMSSSGGSRPDGR